MKKENLKVQGVSYHDDDVDGKKYLKINECFKVRTNSISPQHNHNLE